VSEGVYVREREEIRGERKEKKRERERRDRERERGTKKGSEE
jgi:hypothetical protein